MCVCAAKTNGDKSYPDILKMDLRMDNQDTNVHKLLKPIYILEPHYINTMQSQYKHTIIITNQHKCAEWAYETVIKS